jgi:hypothetical protein
MKNSRPATPVGRLAPLLLLALPTFCFGAESYWLKGQSGGFASFYLIGGNYDIDIYARRPHTVEAASRSCFFSGVFQRVAPNPETMPIGISIPISTIVPYKVGPKRIPLPAGLYVVSLGPGTNCKWDFALSSTADDPTGVAPVAMGQPSANHQRVLDTAALGDAVQFYAQCRTANNQKVPASGTAEFRHDGTVFLSLPLNIAPDVNLADVFFVNTTFGPDHQKYLGKNTVRFTVNLGADKFTSTGEFTLRR